MAKIVLSNPVLRGGTIGFSYENLFDNITKKFDIKKVVGVDGIEPPTSTL